MRVALLLAVLLLLGLLTYVVRALLAWAEDARFNRRCDESRWAATEYTTTDGRVHVILRRSFVHQGKRFLADNDRELAVIEAGDVEYAEKLAAARLQASLEADRTSYLAKPPAFRPDRRA